MDILIRKEEGRDYTEVESLLKKSFGQENESILVKRLRNNPAFIPELSLVAVFENEIVGYILFFPIIIPTGQEHHTSLALAPMSVLPDFQRKGIGKQLIQTGLIKAKEGGFSSVIVAGHPEYYPKFGFKPASLWHIKAPFDVPDNVFMAIELKKGALIKVAGTVQYPKEFNDV
jgi:predicted N-acetyltransferase YhbS